MNVEPSSPEETSPQPDSSPSEPTFRHGVHTTPLGKIYLATDGSALTGAWFEAQTHFGSESELGERVTVSSEPVLQQAARELDEYFDGDRQVFDVPLAPSGTDFQLAVWNALKDIPFGFTTTYGEISKIVGPHAPAQAVGQAVGRNRCIIFLPCHRVVAADGKLSGYSAGLDRKRFLLDFEAPASEADEGTLF